MLRTKIEGPEEILLCPFGDAGIEKLESHLINPKFEIRNPKSETNPKSQIRKQK
jgi:hypothetical protein